MADYEINLMGLSELAKAVDEAKDLAPVKAIVRSNGADMMRLAQMRVPTDTYALKRSAKLQTVDNGLGISVSYHTEYAAYQEYGTRFFAGKFYLKQAFDPISRQFIQDLERLFR